MDKLIKLYNNKRFKTYYKVCQYLMNMIATTFIIIIIAKAVGSNPDKSVDISELTMNGFPYLIGLVLVYFYAYDIIKRVAERKIKKEKNNIE